MENTLLFNFRQYVSLLLKLLTLLNVLRWVLVFTGDLWNLALLLPGSSNWNFLCSYNWSI